MIVNDQTGNVSTDFHILRTSLFGSVCYAACRNSFVVDADGAIRKCTVDLHGSNNFVGRIINNLEFKIDFGALAKWTETQAEFPECASCELVPVCMGRNCPNSFFAGRTNCSLNKEAIFKYLSVLAQRMWEEHNKTSEVEEL